MRCECGVVAVSEATAARTRRHEHAPLPSYGTRRAEIDVCHSRWWRSVCAWSWEFSMVAAPAAGGGQCPHQLGPAVKVQGIERSKILSLGSCQSEARFWSRQQRRHSSLASDPSLRDTPFSPRLQRDAPRCDHLTTLPAAESQREHHLPVAVRRGSRPLLLSGQRRSRPQTDPQMKQPRKRAPR